MFVEVVQGRRGASTSGPATDRTRVAAAAAKLDWSARQGGPVRLVEKDAFRARWVFRHHGRGGYPGGSAPGRASWQLKAPRAFRNAPIVRATGRKGVLADQHRDPGIPDPAQHWSATQGELGRVQVGYCAAARKLTWDLPAGTGDALGRRGINVPLPYRSQPEAALSPEAVDGAKSPATRGATVRRRARAFRVESRSRQEASGPEKPPAVAAAEGGRDLARRGKPPRVNGRREPHRGGNVAGAGEEPREGLLDEGRRPGSSAATGLHGTMAKAISVVGQEASPQALSTARR